MGIDTVFLTEKNNTITIKNDFKIGSVRLL